jgi:hypothetical protein
LLNISSKKSSNTLRTIRNLKFKVKDRREGRREISLIGFQNPPRRRRRCISPETDLGIHTKLPAAAPKSVTTGHVSTRSRRHDHRPEQRQPHNGETPSRMRGIHSRDRRRRSFSGRSARPVFCLRPLPAIHRQRVSAPPAKGHVQQRQRQDESRPQTAISGPRQADRG